MNETILLVEDEMRLARWTQTYIERAGYVCLWVTNGRDALHMARSHKPHLIVLDIMLPEVDGWAVCKQIRKQSSVPIIMLTAKIAEQDIIDGLKMGADDYVTKPFNPHELIARIEANLRRASGHVGPQHRLTCGWITLDLNTRQCFVQERLVSLTMAQFNLLEYFLRHPGYTLSRDQIINDVFGAEHDSYSRSIDVHIRRLRTKIEKDPSNPQYLQTVFGVGYRFCPE